jgi:Sulfotransferase domain
MRGEGSQGLQIVVPVTWLASYPRSGNTLLRLILKHCFGLLSQSLYQDQDFADPAIRDMVGHEEVGSNARQFVHLARRAGRGLYVKTHEPPQADRHPAIYVVRDGRSAVVSHAHYLRDILRRDITLAEVIEGKAGLSWSQHVRAWTLPPRENTLVVRYEDMASGNRDTLAAISAFIGHPAQRGFELSFEHLHALHPGFFRRGSDAANIAELDAASMGLFEQHHGDMMRVMGYGARANSGRRPPVQIKGPDQSGPSLAKDLNADQP